MFFRQKVCSCPPWKIFVPLGKNSADAHDVNTNLTLCRINVNVNINIHVDNYFNVDFNVIVNAAVDVIIVTAIYVEVVITDNVDIFDDVLANA